MPTNGALAGCLDRSQDRNAEDVLISTNRDPSSSLCPADTPALRMQKDCLIMVAVGWGWCRTGAGEMDRTGNHAMHASLT